jgi:hypothetical protein
MNFRFFRRKGEPTNPPADPQSEQKKLEEIPQDQEKSVLSAEEIAELTRAELPPSESM